MSRLEVAACLALFVVGVYSTSFGPALGILADDFGVSLDHAGIMLTLLFLGSIVASGSMAVWLHRFDPKHFAATGLVLVAAGTVGVGLVGSWTAVLVSVCVVGAGGGLMDAGSHTIAARESADVSRGVNRLNVFFAIGAIVGPLWSGSVLSVDDGARSVVYLGIAALAAAVAAAMLSAPSSPVREVATAGHVSHTAETRMTALAWAIGGLLFLYVGAEFGLGSWVASYSEKEFETGIFTGGLITAGYWAALMVGRVISGMLFAHGVPAQRVLIGSVAGGMVASAAIALASDLFLAAAVAAFATGLAFGPIWPSAMSIAASGRSSNAPAAMVTIGNAGGFVFPWLQGRLLVSAGGSTGIGLSAVLCAAMLAIAWWIGQAGRNRSAS
ncbi:MAG: sugar MFS transporter [Dehalococcoidia bacterium]